MGAKDVLALVMQTVCGVLHANCNSVTVCRRLSSVGLKCVCFVFVLPYCAVLG